MKLCVRSVYLPSVRAVGKCTQIGLAQASSPSSWSGADVVPAQPRSSGFIVRPFEINARCLLGSVEKT